MPRDGSGVYSLPAGTAAVAATQASSSNVNSRFSDLASDANTVRPIAYGGTGASSASAARTSLGLAIGTNVQAQNANLQSLSGLTFAANKGLYTTGANTAALFDLTAAGRALLDDADAAAQRVTLGLGDLATRDDITTAEMAPATLVTESEGIGSNDNDTTLPTSAAVKSYVDAQVLSAGGWQAVETLTMTGTTVTTANFVAGYDYGFVVQGVSHNNATSKVLLLEAFSGSWVGPVGFTDGMVASNFEYGFYEMIQPSLARNTHVFTGSSFRTLSPSTTTHVVDLLNGRKGCVFNFATASTITRIRFSVQDGASFDAGTILVLRR